MQRKILNPVLLVLIVAAGAAGLAFWSQPPFDPDLGWHLFGGAFVVNHQAVPSEDLINSFSTRWHDYHWLAQLGMFKVYQRFGYQGLSVALGIILSAISLLMLLLANRCHLLRRSPILALSALLLALFLMAKVTSVRPQVLSMLILALTLLRLKGKETWYEGIFLFVLAVAAANIHVYWIFVPFLYALYRVLPAFIAGSRRRFYCSGLTLTFLSLAALISPYGIFHGRGGWIWENYALLFDYLIMPDTVSQTIGELQSAFSSGTVTALLICFYLVIFACGFRKKDIKSHSSDLICAFVGVVLAVKATKFLAILALFSFPYFLTTLFRCSIPFRYRSLARGSRITFAVIALFASGLLMRAMYVFPNVAVLEKQLADNLPIKACQKIAELPLVPSTPRTHVRVLTHFNYGGWCRWIMFSQAPERDLRVTIDGRTQWFPPQFFSQAIDLYNARYQWLETLKQWNPDVLLVQRDKPLANFLVLAKGDWTLEYEDTSFAVFTPKIHQ